MIAKFLPINGIETFAAILGRACGAKTGSGDDFEGVIGENAACEGVAYRFGEANEVATAFLGRVGKFVSRVEVVYGFPELEPKEYTDVNGATGEALEGNVAT